MSLNLWLFEIDAHGDLLAAHVQLHGLAVPYLLLLLRAQFDVVYLLHVFEFPFHFDVRHPAVDDRFRFRVEL